MGSESTPPDGQSSPATAVPDVCPACSGVGSQVLFPATDRIFGTTDKVFHIVECRQCRLIRLHPQPTPRELRDYYPRDYWIEPETTVTDKLEVLYRRFVLRDHLRFVERALAESGEPGLVVDVGCGSGAFLKMLRDRGRNKIVGIEWALDAAAAAVHRSGVPAICGTLSRAPFAAGSCAAITMFHVLEHLYEPARYLEAAHELLAPGGRLIVHVPNAASWEFLLFGERWSGLEVPRRLFHFRQRDLETLLRDSGFEVLRYKHFSLKDNPQGLATSLAPLLDPTGRRLRRVSETSRVRLWKDIAFLALVALCVPFTLLEAACHAGSTVMIEARKKP